MGLGHKRGCRAAVQIPLNVEAGHRAGRGRKPSAARECMQMESKLDQWLPSMKVVLKGGARLHIQAEQVQKGSRGRTDDIQEGGVAAAAAAAR